MNKWYPYTKPKASLALFCLMIVYLITGIAYILVTPILEKSDEQGHYGYILYLNEHKTLPPLQINDDLSFQFKQPPLYYSLVWLFNGVGIFPTAPFELPEQNPYIDSASPHKRNDNRNLYLHPPHHTLVGIIARLTSLMFGLGTTLITYNIALEVFNNKRYFALVSAIIIGFQPRFLYMATAVNNDASAACFGAAISLLLVLYYKKPEFKQFPFIMGVVLGLALLAKTSTLLFLPLVALALLIHPHQSLRNLFREGLIIALLTALIGGWWYMRNAICYEDALTLRAHLGNTTIGILDPDKLGHTLKSIEYTFWGNLARPTLKPIAMDYSLIWWGRISSLVLIWALLKSLTRSSINRSILVLLSIPTTYFIILVGYWNASQSFAFGRLLFPALCPLIILWLWGWQQIASGVWEKVALQLSGGMMLCVGLITPVISIYPLYHPYHPFDAHRITNLSHYIYLDEHGYQIAELIGYRLPEEYTTPGNFTTVELCWRSLGHTPEPFAIFVHILDISELDKPNGPSIFGSRRTYPGLGNLPTDRWPIQKTFCDLIMVPLTHDLPAPSQTLLEIGFINPRDGIRLMSTDSENNLVFSIVAGPVILPPSPLSQEIPAMYILDKAITLTQIETSIQYNTLSITLIWQSHEPVTYDAVIFIHLRDAHGNLLSHIDAPPLQGRFPTSAWIPGQVLTDTFDLLLPTDYERPLYIDLGMYEKHSLERLPVTDHHAIPQVNHLITISLEN